MRKDKGHNGDLDRLPMLAWIMLLRFLPFIDQEKRPVPNRKSSPKAHKILNDLLEKCATDGELQFTLPDVLKVLPISKHGNVNEIIGKFGGADQLRNAMNQLQTLLYGV